MTKNSAVAPAEEKYRRLKLRWVLGGRAWLGGRAAGWARAALVLESSPARRERWRHPPDPQCADHAFMPPTQPSLNPRPPAPRSNAKIQSTIVEVEGGLAAMAALGWQEEQENGEAVLALPKGGATMAQVSGSM